MSGSSDWGSTKMMDRAISGSSRVANLADEQDPIFRSFAAADFSDRRRTNLAGITRLDSDDARNHDPVAVVNLVEASYDVLKLIHG